MFTTDDIAKSSARFNEILSKRARPRTANDSPVAYQSLSVVRKISQAKFAVYLTSSKINNKNYAMKVFTQSTEEAQAYYKNETRFAILKHPNVIDIVHYEEDKETIHKGELKKVSYILMEFAPYGDLFDFIIKHKDQIDEKLIRTYFRQLINGMEYLHERGVAHLDLKPENLLLGADFNLKIADFDLSHVNGDAKILSRGTRYYRGPEFFTKTGSSGFELSDPFSADIYSAGVILFILKSGGMYPHSEGEILGGVDFESLMYRKNSKFWEKHCEVQGKKPAFFGRDFKDLFNGMVKEKPSNRLTIRKIKQSKWYNGPVYSTSELNEKMKQILGLNYSKSL